jgi:hypothetical protein
VALKRAPFQTYKEMDQDGNTRWFPVKIENNLGSRNYRGLLNWEH